MNRRELILAMMLVPAMRGMATVFDDEDDTRAELTRLLEEVVKGSWASLPIGELMGNIAMEMQGAPYLGGTLEGEGPEKCRIDLITMDCVTFFENVLGIARIVKKGKTTFADLRKEITYTRYRDGKLNGYTSRLHYTAEWIQNNIEKGVVKDVTSEMGGVELKIDDHFMSAHPQYYDPLKKNPKLVDAIKKIEQRINTTPRTFIPKSEIEDAEEFMQTGDIVAVATSKDGLDYAHTGMIYRSKKGESRFLHASTKKDMVTLDANISEYVNSVESHTGITLVRPLEPTT